MSEEKKDETKKIKKVKKPETLKKIILTRLIFIIVFIAVAIGVTFYLANKNKPEVKSKNTITNTVIKQEENIEKPNEKTLDLDGTYNANPIKFKTYTMDIFGNEIEYIQMDGLKDEAIEIKINQAIKKKIEEKATEFCNENSFTEIYSDCYVTANFANVISISSYIYSYNDDNEYNEEILYFNYNLVDGTEITLKDIFSSELSIEELLIDKLYEGLVSEFSVMNEETWDLYVSEDAEDIEEIVYLIVSDYQRGKKIDFYITPQRLEVKAGKYSSEKILFKDYAKYLTIYDKFLTSNEIYDGQYTALKNMDVLTDIERMAPVEQYVEKEGENYYINACLYSLCNFEVPEKTIEAIKTYMNDYIEEMQLEYKEAGIFRIYNVMFLIYENDKNGEYKVYIYDYRYDTTKSKYNNLIKEKIKEFFREDYSNAPDLVGNDFVFRIDIAETIYDENGYGYDVNYDYNYYEIILDEIGNIISNDDQDNILETID